MAFDVYAIEDAKEHVATLLDKAYSAEKYSSAYLKEGFASYQPLIRSDTFNELEVLNEMYDALKRGEFTFFLQPILDLETGNSISVEALARWNHPKRGIILPNQFIPVFEKYGFITTFDLFMLSKVCTFLSQNKLTVPISLNLSRIDVSNRNIVEHIIETIEENPVDYAGIQFEVTENAYIENPQNMAELVRALQDHGFRILMDDFGSGYSSLMMLSTLPFDVLKVDKVFIQQTTENKRSKAVLSAILQMARENEIPVVVEGIECEIQDQYLRNIGCTAVQ